MFMLKRHFCVSFLFIFILVVYQKSQSQIRSSYYGKLFMYSNTIYTEIKIIMQLLYVVALSIKHLKFEYTINRVLLVVVVTYTDCTTQ